MTVLRNSPRSGKDVRKSWVGQACGIKGVWQCSYYAFYLLVKHVLNDAEFGDVVKSSNNFRSKILNYGERSVSQGRGNGYECFVFLGL